MRAAEFRAWREFLGLDGPWLARHLGINPRTVERWEAGVSPVPQFAADALSLLRAEADDIVADHVERLRETPEGVPPVLAIGDEADERPARWQRHIAARVAGHVPGLIIA